MTPGTRLGFEVIDRGITHDASGSRTIALTCFPAITGAVSSPTPVGSGDGDIALYVRALDIGSPRQACFFRFSTMQNYHLFDDPHVTPFAVGMNGRCVYHVTYDGVNASNDAGTNDYIISDVKTDAHNSVVNDSSRIILNRISFDDFSVTTTPCPLPPGHALTDNGACNDGSAFYFFTIKDGVYYLCGAPTDGIIELCGNAAVITETRGTQINDNAAPHSNAAVLTEISGTPTSVATTQQGVYFTAMDNVPCGLNLFDREHNISFLYFYSFATKLTTHVQSPLLYGKLAYADGVLAVPLLSGGLYFPFSASTLSNDCVVEHVSLSSDGKYFVFTTPGNDVIYAGSVATSRVRALNHNKNTRGSGWFNRPSCAFTGDSRWVIYGSNYTGVPQAYAAYVPDNFLSSLDNPGGSSDRYGA